MGNIMTIFIKNNFILYISLLTIIHTFSSRCFAMQKTDEASSLEKAAEFTWIIPDKIAAMKRPCFRTITPLLAKHNIGLVVNLIHPEETFSLP